MDEIHKGINGSEAEVEALVVALGGNLAVRGSLLSDQSENASIAGSSGTSRISAQKTARTQTAQESLNMRAKIARCESNEKEEKKVERF